MVNYTQLLKEIWKSDDLSFFSRFSKYKEKEGFFNDFVNPYTQHKIFYPDTEHVQVVDRRISFYHPNCANYIDGDYYKVELQYTTTPKGKNNPFSLEIKKVTAVDQPLSSHFLKSRDKENLLVNNFSLNKSDQKPKGRMLYGQYYKQSERFAYFTNVMFADTGEILMFQGESQKVFVTPNLELIEGGYHSFTMVKNEGKLPSAIPNSILSLETNPYQEYIRLRFERLNNPEANKMIANLMREIGKGMYSSKQRMIFELLQNADDAPGKEKVEFHIDINKDYFFIMHDGAPFNKDDVEAITSAAESTKRGDNKKTGYKGIGFKSVFTDSNEVWLKSGGYQFAFLRNSPLFNEFDAFYFSSKRYKDHPEFVKEDKLKFRNQMLRFNGTTDLPWQVLPIWQDNLPIEFNDSNFNNFDNPVQFALRLGENNIEDYKIAIDNITKRPQFLLFLRNTSKFSARRNGVMVLRKDTKGVIEILKLKGEDKQTFYYIKKTFANIEVSDQAFEQLNIGLKKQSRENSYGEINYYFTDLDGREIETIPPKLASATLTEISFGISLSNNKISPEKEYTKGLPKYSSLFTYLPMEDTRFQLPFLVNADFVPSSDRQRIQGDNLWNKYVIIKVAEKHVETLAYYAQEFLKDNPTHSSYLSLLLNKLLPEDDTAQQIINSYNNKYQEQLEINHIVVNDINQTQLLSNTLIDNSGLIELFGQEMFYEIIETEKRLPHFNLDNSYLKNYHYLNIEVVNIELLADKITPETCESLGIVIAEKSLYGKPELLEWLNRLATYIPDKFGKIPFIFHNNSVFSLEALLDESNAWLINENTSQYQALIKDLGYHTININLDKYSNIKEYLHTLKGYINDKNSAYERIASNSKLSNLSITVKLSLIDFFQNSLFMEGIGKTKYFGELDLFVDESGKAKPLRQLLSRGEALDVYSITKFRIVEAEFNSLPVALKKELITKDEIFTSFILDEDLFEEWSQLFTSDNISAYVNDLKSIYSWVINKDEISGADWASIPWLYINDEDRFVATDKIYWSNAFNGLSSDQYETIKSILHTTGIKTLPLQVCGEIIKAFKLNVDDGSDICWADVAELEMISANTLLDWMENDGSFGDFFESYTLEANERGLYTIIEIETAHIFDGSDKELSAYIQSNEKLALIFDVLDKNLSKESRYKIGLLQGDKLFKAIIDSGVYDQNLAVHLPTNASSELLHRFIGGLDVFKLNTGLEYGSDSPEHFIINHLLKNIENIIAIPPEFQKTIEEIRNKITINDSPLSNYTISDRVSFGTKEDRKVLKLSDILAEFLGESDVLDAVKESFTAISQKAKLRELIFRTIPLKPEQIHAKIEEEKNSHYTVHQVVFQLLDKNYGGKRTWAKQRFDDYFKKNGNEERLHGSYQEFLDILIELPFTHLLDFKFYGLVLSNCVDKNFAIESERIPNWLEEWIVKDQTKRLEFLPKLGYNGSGSAIVNLRKSMIAKDYDQNSVIRYFEESKPNMQNIWNTIVWLSDFNPSIVSINISVIKQVNNYIRFQPHGIKQITVPLVKFINAEGERTYHLQALNTESELLKIDTQSEFSDSIFSSLNNMFNNPLIVDESIGKLSDYLNITVVQLEESIDLESLEAKSKLWTEPFYKKWEYNSAYPIYIYDGDEIPYRRTFKGITITKFTSDLKVVNDGTFYVSKVLIKDVLNNLPSSFPANMLADLKDWHYKTLQNESLLDEDSFDYQEEIDRLLQDRLGISKEDQKRESGNAKTHAIYFLAENGYDVSNVNNAGAALTDIIDSDGIQIKCIVRSAKGGLLYLDKEHWDMLEAEHMFLIVIYPGNSPRLFKNRLELLEDELAENVLFRVFNNKLTSEIDGVFNALKSESHLILVTSEKMKESLFSKLKQKNGFYKEENAAIGGDDFML